MPGTLDSWYEELRKWTELGRCSEISNGLDPFLKVIPPELFRECLNQFLDSDEGKPYEMDLKFDDGGVKQFRDVIAFRQTI